MEDLICIGDVARAVGVSVEMVRRYEAAGIVTARRDSRGKRLFTQDQVSKLQAHRSRLRPHAGKAGAPARIST